MNVLTIDTSQLTQFAAKLQNMSKALDQAVDDVLNASAIEMELKAKQLAPVNEGLLRGQISANTSKHLYKEINVNVFYAAWIEFGTGHYAAAYVASLPADWKAYAAQFRGKSGGTFAQMLKRLQTWVRLKGIATAKDANRVAYLIARSILIKGVRPHPFLYPAFVQQKPILEKDLDTAIKTVI